MVFNVENIFLKALIFILITLTGLSCYAFFWKESADCFKDLSCVRFTTALIEAEKREVLGAQEIKELANTHGFKFKSNHQDGKGTPFEIGKNVFFDEGDGGIFLISKSRFDKPYSHLVRIGLAEYKGDVIYFSVVDENFKKIESNDKEAITKLVDNLFFVISESGHIMVDYKNRTVLFTTSDYWDVGHRQKKFS